MIYGPRNTNLTLQIRLGFNRVYFLTSTSPYKIFANGIKIRHISSSQIKDRTEVHVFSSVVHIGSD